MIVQLFSLFLALTVKLDGSVPHLQLVLVNNAGEVVRLMPATASGEYIFDDLDSGTYSVRAVLGEFVVASIPEVVVPLTESVSMTVSAESVDSSSQQEEGARRNQNIQVNLIDTQALIESLGRQGAQVRPVVDFSASRQTFAVELGGIGPTPQINSGAARTTYHGQIYESHNDHIFNARTFFQVGEVLPSRRNQYGFSVGGPIGSRGLSFQLNAEEVRESGFVNGNVLVPLPSERTATAEDPAVRSLVQKWLDAYPKELPNRPAIDERLLNTNARQHVRNTGGGLRFDWQRNDRQLYSANYTFADTFIDSFEHVGGQNPDQRLRPQNLNFAADTRLSGRTVLRAGFNFVRRKIHVLVPPASVGSFVNVSGFEALGPSFELPIRRVSNDFEYLAQTSTAFDRHQFDWGGTLQRSQVNEYQADAARGVFTFQSDEGRSAIDNFRIGEVTRYTTILGELYRGFRVTNVTAFVNDRAAVRPNLHLTLGLRYEFAGKPSEVNNLTKFPQSSDGNNVAPRVGLAWSAGSFTVRSGYGIAYGSVSPATYRVARLNPPDVIWVRVQYPNLIDPLRDFKLTPREALRGGLNLIDPELVVPYTHQYTLEVSREIRAGFTVKAAYSGSRTWKLFRIVRENRAIPVDGIPLTTRTTDLRRPDPTALSIARMTNQARSYFDAGQLTFTKTFGSQLSLNATYTWSKALDTGSDFSNPGTNRQEQFAQTEAFALQDLKSLSSFDVPHSFVIGYSFELPTQFLEGWTVSGITILKDGTPFDIETGTDGPPYGNADGERGDRPSILDPSILGSSVDDPDTALQILRREVFDAEAPSRQGYGNIPRSAFRKDGTTNFNLSVSRRFTMSGDGSRTLLFRSEFINAFNHPQFSPPTSRLTDPSFGQITNTLNAGRIIQFHLRLSF